MPKRAVAIAGGLLALAWLTVGVAWTKGKTTAERITIAGPGMTRTIEVTDLVTLQKLSLSRLEDLEQPVNVPQNIGPGYIIIRYFRDGGYVEPAPHPDAVLDPAQEVQFQRQQGFRPMDKVRYHPDLAGGPGYIFYIQLNLNIVVPYEGEWYRATEVGDATIRRILKENNVSLAVEDAPTQSWLTNKGAHLLLVVTSVVVMSALLLRLVWRRLSYATHGQGGSPTPGNESSG